MRTHWFEGRTRLIVIAVACLLMVLLAACAKQPRPVLYNANNFWLGLVHGFISLFSLIGSLFTDARVYAYPNTGFGYDLGFVIGAALFYGGASRAR
jgi:hypothetical protein